MAIARSVRPSVLVAGEVARTRELRKKSDQTVYGYEVVVGQSSGAQIAVTIYSEAASRMSFPEIGDFLAAECTVEESKDFGASLNYSADGAEMLDRIHTALRQTAAA